MREIELKLELDDGFDLSTLHVLEDYEVGELPKQTLSATYYDTEDLRLARWRASLRFRTGENRGTWTLKLPGDDGRDELNFEGKQGQIPTELKRLVAAIIRHEGLKPVVRLRTKRKRWSVRDMGTDEPLAELAYDEVAVLHGRRVTQRFREVEIEAIDGDGIGIAKIGNAIRRKGATEGPQTPKVIRALGEKASAASDPPPTGPVKPSDPARDAVRAAMTANVSRLIRNDPPTRLGSTEGLHQMRVACRRLRSDLKTFASLVEKEWAQDLARDLKWIGDVLGEVRDLDVMIDRLHASSKDLETQLSPLFEVLADRQAAARQTVIAALQSKRYIDLLEGLVAAAERPVTTQEAERPCQDVLVPLVATRWRKLSGAAKAASAEASDEVLHDIRIKTKKVRYAAEAVAPALGKKRRNELLVFAENVVSLQATLGAHQDASVAMSTIRGSVSGDVVDADFVFAAGRLFEREAAEARKSRREIKKVWATIDRKKNLGWLTR